LHGIPEDNDKRTIITDGTLFKNRNLDLSNTSSFSVRITAIL
jgi:hypothetical protein